MEDNLLVAFLNENLETAGLRRVEVTVRVFARFPTEDWTLQQLRIEQRFRMVEEIEIGQHNTADQPAAAGTGYLGVTVKLPNNLFERQGARQEAFEDLLRRFGLTTWGIGRGIAHRQEEDLFIVDMNDDDENRWLLYLTLAATDTYATCLERANTIDTWACDMMKRDETSRK